MGVWPSPSMRKQSMFWPRQIDIYIYICIYYIILYYIILYIYYVLYYIYYILYTYIYIYHHGKMPYKPRLWRLSSSACHNNCRACCHSPDLPHGDVGKIPWENPMAKSVVLLFLRSGRSPKNPQNHGELRWNHHDILEKTWTDCCPSTLGILRRQMKSI